MTTVPFTVIDEAVHALDTPAEPWSIQLELRVEGRLDDDRLRDAVGRALARHPMARARGLPARHTDRCWHWELTATPDLEPLRILSCRTDDELARVRADFQSRQVSIAESPPLRLRLVHHPGGDVLMANVNHVAFDGYGAVRLLRSLARSYAGETEPEPLVSLDEARDVVGLLDTGDRAVRARRLRFVGTKLTDLVRPPVRIAPDGGEDRPGYGFHHVVLAPEETARLAAAPAGVTVTAVLVAALHLAIGRWNEDRGRRAGRISTLVPVNLRPREWRAEAVTNLVLDANVVTARRDRRDPDALSAAVGRQIERMKAGGGAALIEVLGTWSGWPVWAKETLSPLLWLTGNRLVDTAVLSNLGVLRDPPRFAGAGETVEAWFSAPSRMPCGVSVGAVTLHDRLHLSFRHRHPVLGGQGAERFADGYRRALARVATAS